MSNMIVVVCLVLLFSFADALRNSGTGMHCRLNMQDKGEIYTDNKLLPKHDIPVGNPMLPWCPVQPDFLGRDKENVQLYKAAEADFWEKSAERAGWSVIYASGRSGGGKTEIGKQAPYQIYSRCENGSEMQRVLGGASYLFIDMNGGGDAYDPKDDYALKPEARMGWRLLAAVCRGSLGTRGVRMLRNKIAALKGPDVSTALRGKNFNAIADLLDEVDYKLDYNLEAREVLLALSHDLRGTTCNNGLNSNERVAIHVHVDEHQLIYGKGLSVGATDEEKLDAHKAFLYDLCLLRGDGERTWCNNNNIFLLPIFTGTASVVLKGLTAQTSFSNKIRLRLLPLSASASQTLFLNSVKVLNDDNTFKKKVHPSWTKEVGGKTPPLHFLLQELGGIPRLIKVKLPKDTSTMDILSEEYSYKSLQQAFDSLNTGNIGKRVGEEMTRVVVSGAFLANHSIILDGKTVDDYEFDGTILLTEDGEGSVRLPAIDYRKSIARIRDLSNIAAFVNQKFDSENWSDLWEKMGMDRFQNMLFVYGRLLKKNSITLKKLYPGCDIPEVFSGIDLTTAIKFTRFGDLRVCDKKFDFDSTAWTAMIENIRDGECRSVKLKKNHPTFDVIHLIRNEDVLWCFLEQYKAPNSPTRESFPKSFDGIKLTCTKFAKVIKEMADAAAREGLRLRVVPVHIDFREKNNEKLTQFHTDLWKGKQFKDLPIFTTVTGTGESIPSLFPCIAHRFVLLEEEEKERRAS